jgi:hypothetical protein
MTTPALLSILFCQTKNPSLLLGPVEVVNKRRLFKPLVEHCEAVPIRCGTSISPEKNVSYGTLRSGPYWSRAALR